MKHEISKQMSIIYDLSEHSVVTVLHETMHDIVMYCKRYARRASESY
jgi:hypothetical protein